MTDLGCACICSWDYDPADVYNEKIQKARKKHTCCECGEAIQPGEKYQYAAGLWEGHWEHFKTCTPCLRIRKDVCCDGFIFGELREAIGEAYGFDYVTGDYGDDDEEE